MPVAPEEIPIAVAGEVERDAIEPSAKWQGRTRRGTGPIRGRRG